MPKVVDSPRLLSADSPIVITGMHRSATSFAASLFHLGGISFGEELVAADAGNQPGHFEDVRFQEFHRAVLRGLGLSEHGWILDQQVHVSEQQEQIAFEILKSAEGRPIWGWKDPRTTLFLEFWARLVPNARYIFLYRAAWDVADSLYRRNEPHDQIFSEQPDLAIEVWAHYNQRILRFIEAHPTSCILVNADALIRNPGNLQNLIRDRFGIEWSACTPEVCKPQLYHSEISSTGLPELICRQFPAVPHVWAELEQRSAFRTSDLSLPSGNISNKVPVDVPRTIRDWVNWRRSAVPRNKPLAEAEQAFKA